MASAHDHLPARICDLCDFLVVSIQSQLPGIESKAGENWCSIGKPTFAFVNHSRSGLTVFLRCRERDGDGLSALINPSNAVVLAKRKGLGSAWAQTTPYFLKIETRNQATAAVPLLLRVARDPSRIARQSVSPLPSEDHAAERIEGERATVYVNRYERDAKARAARIKIFGAVCSVCCFDFGKTYRDIGAGFIHVHHLNPLVAAAKAHKVNPRGDLRPVCANCHEMLHQRKPVPFSIEELKASSLSDLIFSCRLRY